MFVVLYLTHGATARTSVAVLGTLASLVLTGVLGALAAAIHLTGFGSEDATTLAMVHGEVDLHGLLLAGIIIASVVNTIVLAYAGASLPALLLIVDGGRSVVEVLTSEFLAQEIVRSAVATLGPVAAVPITTALAALVTTAGRYTTATRPPRPRIDRSEALAALSTPLGASRWEPSVSETVRLRRAASRPDETES